MGVLVSAEERWGLWGVFYRMGYGVQGTGVGEKKARGSGWQGVSAAGESAAGILKKKAPAVQGLCIRE